MKKAVLFVFVICLLSYSAFSMAEYETLKPGSEGQAVMDARMRLYELGYFTKIPTKIEYTNDMMNYVKRFEADYGLEQDGILSPEDQEVLFGRSSSGEALEAFEPIAIVSDHLQIDGLFINEDYKSIESDALVQVVLCYTVHAGDKNFEISGDATQIAFENGNTYKAEHYKDSCLYLGSYYYSSYIQKLYVGETIKMVDTIMVPRGELTPGRKLSLSSTCISDMALASLSTDDIISMNNMEEIAKKVDLEGYRKIKNALTEADSSIQKKVRNQMNNYYWSFSIGSLSYRIDFNKKTYTLNSMGLETTGKYTICNGYVVLTHDSNGYKVYVPYTLDNGELDLNIAAGFDVRQN